MLFRRVIFQLPNPLVLTLIISCRYKQTWGTAVAQWLRCCATNQKVAGSIPAGVSGFVIDIKSFWSHYGPEVDSASNRNECQEHFLGGKKRPVRKADNLPPSCAVVTKSGNLNFLEPSGPVQACNGTALPLPLQTNLNNKIKCESIFFIQCSPLSQRALLFGRFQSFGRLCFWLDRRVEHWWNDTDRGKPE